MLINRDIEKELITLSKTYPVVTITGPRQSGKTTLAKKVFKDYTYCNLEEPEIRSLAQDDSKNDRQSKHPERNINRYNQWN